MKCIKNTIPILSFLLILGCSDSKMECENAMCTELFASVQVKVIDTSQTNLDSITTQTVIPTTGEVLHTQTEVDPMNQGFFTIVDDTNLKAIGFNKTQEVELRLFKQKKLIKNIPFTIKTDCCHVSKLSGVDQISLN